MRTSPAGRAAITAYEGSMLQAYLCSAGVPTIGVGHTRGVKMGQSCTSEQVQQWLAEDLADAEEAVNRLVKVHLTQNQFDALVSFTFNLGAGALAKSTLLRLLNGAQYAEAVGQFRLWNLAGGKPSLGLTKRRASEAAMFAANLK